MNLVSRTAAASLVLLALAPAHAHARTTVTCYDFDHLVAGASWPVDASEPVRISIGEVRIRPLKLDGVEVAPAHRFFRVAEGGQHIAGGTAPEMQGKNVAVQIVPSAGASSISMKVSHQPGPELGRAAMVEVNGARHDWSGSLASLHERAIGSGRDAASFEVDIMPLNDSLWHSGWLKVTADHEIHSFTIGAAELRLDDVCIER